MALKMRLLQPAILVQLLFFNSVVSIPRPETVTELPLDNLISLFQSSPPIAPTLQQDQSQFLRKSSEQDVIVEDETFKVVTLDWYDGGRDDQDHDYNYKNNNNNQQNTPTLGKEEYRNRDHSELLYGHKHKQPQVEQSPLGESSQSNGSSSEPYINLTSHERRRIRSIAPPHPHHKRLHPFPRTRRKKRALTSIQKKYWWPFNRKKEIVITKSLSPKHEKPENERWSSCEGHCSCNHYGKCHHHHGHHHDYGQSHKHSNGPGISYVHHIHHNQQQQLLLGQGELGLGGRSSIPHPLGHPPPPPPHPGHGPRLSSAEEIAVEKREVSLIQEKIRLKEEIHRLRDDQRREEGVKEIHHHHGPTHLHGHSRRRRKPPPPHHRHPSFRPEDNSSSEEDEDELDKRLKIVETEKKTAKVHLLASLLSQMGVGGLVTDLLHHGISRIPNSFGGGFPGGYFSVGSSGGGYGGPYNRDSPSSNNRDPPKSENSPNSNQGTQNSNPSQSQGSGPTPVRPPTAGAAPMTMMPVNNAPMMMTGAGMSSAPAVMMGSNAAMMGSNAAMMGMNAGGMVGMGAMNAGMMTPAAPQPAPVPAATPPVAPAPLANPAVQLAAQILLEDALSEQSDVRSEESSSDEEADDNTIDGEISNSIRSPPFHSGSEEEEHFSRDHPTPKSVKYSYESKSKTGIIRSDKEQEDDDDERENFSELADDSLEELLDGLR